MKYRNILPTDENVVSTFCDDYIERNHDVIDFCRILSSINGPYTLSIDGGWGCGKTFYVKQIKLILDYFGNATYIDDGHSKLLQDYFSANPDMKERGNSICPLATVYFDAWENDNDIDPLLSIMYTILQSYGGDEPKFNAVFTKICKIVDIISGKNISALFNDESRDSRSLFAALNNERSLHEYMDLFIREAIQTRGNKLIIFIDELDRCKPTYAVKLLERIKHFMSNEQLIFVFSTNITQLQHTIRACYGADFDGTRYLNRFFDLPTHLAPVSLEQYFDKIGYSAENTINVTVCELTIKYFHFEIREIANFLQAYNSSLDIDKIKTRSLGLGKLPPFLILIPPIMLGLSMSNKSQYDLFVQGEFPDPLVDILIESDLFEYVERIIYGKATRRSNETISIVEKQALLTDLYYSIFAPQKIEKSEHTRDFRIKNQLLQILSQVSLYSNWNK